ncbi:uncharacterized protein EI97DRAFT_454500 [Westerdykella ornata]|uniref:BAH domain-containing protein n=1 Tax=Westerdykella ornata TaxID=318751 RepID=A0A6A6JYL1_WESOR|nr:uncharacterized protein EI97DRAFT_454500 [Westerdykella ornata]KAF2281295.1 hypothetical protein EI97DRAFT_454500 [Westerdykella ornata]
MARLSAPSTASASQPAPPTPAPSSSGKLKRKRSRKSLDAADARFWAEAERSKELRNGFRITYLSKSPEGQPHAVKKKRRLIDTLRGDNGDNTEANPLKSQPNPFPEADLGDVYYNVEPKSYWEATQLKGLRRCILVDEDDEEEFSIGTYVHIRPGNDAARNAAIDTWIGKVLEIRAGDASHVYVRIYWMYRPEDLPGGRKPYHGTNELIASNDMAVIEAQTIECSVDVYHWEDNANNNFDPEKELYWRQTLDVTDGKKRLSQLDTYCIDHTPANPEIPLLHCEGCNTWLHSSCLEKNAVRIACQNANMPYSSPKKRKRRGRPARPAFAAQFSISKGRPSITIVDQRRGKEKVVRNMLVVCLSCGERIERVSSSQPALLNKESGGEGTNGEKAGKAVETGPQDEGVEEQKEESEEDEALGEQDQAASTATPKVNGTKRDRQSSENTTPTSAPESTERCVDTWDTPARLIRSVSRLFRARSTEPE